MNIQKYILKENINNIRNKMKCFIIRCKTK